MQTYVPTRFTWSQWGSRVCIAGSFECDPPIPPWSQTEMQKNSDGVYEVVLNLLPNKEYLYKFVIDYDCWVCDPSLTSYPDGGGNMNHVIRVEPPPPPPPKEEIQEKEIAVEENVIEQVEKQEEPKEDYIASEHEEHKEEKEQPEVVVEENERIAEEPKESVLTDEINVLTTKSSEQQEEKEEKEETIETETIITNTIVERQENEEESSSVITNVIEPSPSVFSVNDDETIIKSDNNLSAEHVANDETYDVKETSNEPQNALSRDDSTTTESGDALKDITEPSSMAIKPVEIGEEIDEMNLTEDVPSERLTETVDENEIKPVEVVEDFDETNLTEDVPFERSTETVDEIKHEDVEDVDEINLIRSTETVDETKHDDVEDVGEMNLTKDERSTETVDEIKHEDVEDVGEMNLTNDERSTETVDEIKHEDVEDVGEMNLTKDERSTETIDEIKHEDVEDVGEMNLTKDERSTETVDEIKHEDVDDDDETNLTKDVPFERSTETVDEIKHEDVEDVEDVDETNLTKDVPFERLTETVDEIKHVEDVDEITKDVPFEQLFMETVDEIKPVQVGEDVDKMDHTKDVPFEQLTETVNELSSSIEFSTVSEESINDEKIEEPVVEQVATENSATTEGSINESEFIKVIEQTNDETHEHSGNVTTTTKETIVSSTTETESTDYTEETPLSDDYDELFKPDLESINEEDNTENKTPSETTVDKDLSMDIADFDNITWNGISEDNVSSEWLEPARDNVKWPVNPNEFVGPLEEEKVYIAQLDSVPNPSSDDLDPSSSQLEPPTDHVKPPSLHSDDLTNSSEEPELEELEEPEVPEEPVPNLQIKGATNYYEPPSVWPPTPDDIDKWAEDTADWPDMAKVKEEPVYVEEEQETSTWHLPEETKTINKTPIVIQSREIPSVEETTTDQAKHSDESLLNEIPSTTNIDKSLENTVEEITTHSIVTDNESYVDNKIPVPEINHVEEETKVLEVMEIDHDIGKENVPINATLEIGEKIAYEDLKDVEDSTIDRHPSFISTARYEVPESSATAFMKPTAAAVPLAIVDDTSLDTGKEQHDYLGEDIVISKAIEDLRKYDCSQETQSKSTGVNNVPAGKISQRKITLISPSTSSPGESTRNADTYIHNVATSRETATIKSKPKRPIEISTSREILPRDAKLVRQQRHDNNDKIDGNFIFLMGSVATTFALGMISMIYRIVFDRRVANNRR